MLDLITKSKIRQKIILLLVYNPGKSYYINEIAKLVRTSSGTAKRELERLVKSGFVTKEKKANLIYFKINTASPVWPDLKNIVDKTIGLEHILKEELETLDGIDFAFLFGSYVKGDFRSDSDIDLYIIGDMEEKELYKKIRKAEKQIHREINYHLAAPDEFKEKIKKSFFHKEILSDYNLIIGDEEKFRKFIK